MIYFVIAILIILGVLFIALASSTHRIQTVEADLASLLGSAHNRIDAVEKRVAAAEAKLTGKGAKK